MATQGLSAVTAMLSPMGWFSNQKPGSASAFPRSEHRWAVVDVETSGLSPGRDRVISVAAIALDRDGRPEHSVVSFVDGQCDPGPTHIHGINAKDLVGAPRFSQLAPQLAEVLEGRVLVAHNASFDHGFLAAEATRAGWLFPSSQRLCTLTLSRRLGLEVDNHRLDTLARYWKVQQLRHHDAHDDARVLREIFVHSASLAQRLGLPLPLVACDDGSRAYPAAVRRVVCEFAYAGRCDVGKPLVQGMKVAITGPTRAPREQLAERMTRLGLDVMNSVSGRTGVLVCNDSLSDSGKCQRAREEGVPIVDETVLDQLLADVRPGRPKGAERAIPAPRPRVESAGAAPATAPAGPLSGRRVLVLGGDHAAAAHIRAEVGARGAAVGVNLSASVTDVLVLPGGEVDPRLARAAAAGVRIHHQTAVLLGEAEESSTVVSPSEDGGQPGIPVVAPQVLTCGAVMDLPRGDIWAVNVAWRAEALLDGVDLDVVAFLVDDERRVTEDGDFVFYNAPVSGCGSVSLSIDGDSEQAIRIDLATLPEDCVRVVVAAAVGGELTFGEVGAVTLSIDSSENTVAVAALDAATTERSMLLADIYRRGALWRVRIEGQGYDDGLRELADRHGVEVDATD